MIAFTEQMKKVFRETDVFARLGGDEFVVLFSNTSRKLAADAMKRFSINLDEYNHKASRGYDLSFSYGIVEYDNDRHHTVDALLTEGDRLMYECKKQRRNTESGKISAVSG